MPIKGFYWSAYALVEMVGVVGVMNRVFDVLCLAAVPAIFVGIPAAIFMLSESIPALRDFIDRFGRDL